MRWDDKIEGNQENSCQWRNDNVEVDPKLVIGFALCERTEPQDDQSQIDTEIHECSKYTLFRVEEEETVHSMPQV